MRSDKLHSWLGARAKRWLEAPLFSLITRRSQKGQPERPLLSVYRDYGVILKSDRDDNHNKPGSDLAEYRVVEPGDLVLNKMKTWQGSLGVSDLRGIVSPAYIVCRVTGPVEGRFLHHQLRSYPWIQHYASCSYGVRPDQWDLHFEDLRRTPVFLPQREEQRRVADHLDRKTAAIDDLIRKKERLIELLQEKRQALITQTVTKGLDPTVPMKDSGIGWLGQIPSGWQVKRLKHLSPQLSGRLVVSPDRFFADEGVPVVFGNNIHPGAITGNLRRITAEADEHHARCRVRAGDLLTVRVGDPGTTAVVPEWLDGCHFASAMLIRKHRRFLSAWLCHVMNSDIIQRQIDLVNYGAAQKQFNISDAVNFFVPTPPIDKQEQLARFLDEQAKTLFLQVERIEKSLVLLREYRQALITAAVTGQLDIPAEAA